VSKFNKKFPGKRDVDRETKNKMAQRYGNWVLLMV
jgi:hypothetical protein